MKKPFITKLFDVNKEMIPCKLTYLLFGGVVGSYGPYLPMFLASVGLTSAQAGCMVGIQLIVSSVANPLWGYFADRTGKRRVVLFFLCLGSAVVITPIPWVAMLIQKEQQYGQNATAHPENLLGVSNCSKCTSTLKNVLTVFILFGAAFYTPLGGFLDTITANVIKHSRTKANYGTQRICGSIGSGTTSFLVGLAADHFNFMNLSSYTPVFFYYCAVALIIIPVVSQTIKRTNFGKKEENTNGESGTETETKDTQNASPCSLLLGMAKIPDNLVFLCTVLVSGIAFNMYVYFTLLLMAHETPNTRAMMSLALVVECASNLVMFPLSAPLIRFLRGPSQAIIFALFTYAIRFLVMSYTKTFALMIAVQSLNGLSYALGWCAFMEHVHKIAPKKISMTVFMILASIHSGVCGFIGNVFGGYIFHHFGGRMLFWGLGILCGLWAALLATYRVFLYLHRRKCSQVASFKKSIDVNTTQVDYPAANEHDKAKVSIDVNGNNMQDTGHNNLGVDTVD